MPDLILVWNAGSSTFKYALFAGDKPLHSGKVERRPGTDAKEQVRKILDLLEPFQARDRIVAMGHRVVQGGIPFREPVLIDSKVLGELETLVPLAPLHQPAAIEIIRAVMHECPELPQVACFDTAFHATLPEAESTLPLPLELRELGLRRFGFHGLSYESIARRLPGISGRASQGRTVVAHLGNGSSVCGMLACKSLTTSMSFTPLDGVMMGTRPGRLDPGVVLYLLRNGHTLEKVDSILERQSGLRGVSGVSADVRDLLASPEPAAQLALKMFSRSVAKEIAAAATVLGGLDAIVFTAGIGENSPQIRAAVCQDLLWLGVELDADKNLLNSEQLHSPASRIEVYRLPTLEEATIASHTRITCQPHEKIGVQ